VLSLCCELHSDKCGTLLLVPGQLGKLVGTGARVNRLQEVHIIGGRLTESELVWSFYGAFFCHDIILFRFS
jgi:hypothetical protein